MLTVKELIEELKEFDENMPVILQIDPEGNGYRRVSGTAVVLVEQDTNLYYTQDVMSPEWSADDACYDSEEEWEEWKDQAKKVLVIFP